MNPPVRPVMSIEKLEKAISRFENMVHMLQSSNSLLLHRNVDQSYYMQKLTEFVFLKDQLEAAVKTLEELQHRALVHYNHTYEIWRRDIRIIRETFPIL